MQYVVTKLSALDPDAGAAVQVIAKFDALVERRAGLAPILTAAAAITRYPVRLADARHGIDIRADAHGRVEWGPAPPIDPAWLSVPLVDGGKPAIWLERRADSFSLVDAMVLQRTAFAARETLHRLSAAKPDSRSSALETLFDHRVSEQDRQEVATALRLPADRPLRAIAEAGADPRIECARKSPGSQDTRPAHSRRTGAGPFGSVLDLPESWRQANLALAFAAEDTDRDPGPASVLADELGLLSVLAAGLNRTEEPVPDVDALERASTVAPWALRSLDAFASHGSLRLAAAALFVHHSTLQDRLATLERELGWSIRETSGRLRLHLALAARRFLLHPPREEVFGSWCRASEVR